MGNRVGSERELAIERAVKRMRRDNWRETRNHDVAAIRKQLRRNVAMACPELTSAEVDLVAETLWERIFRPHRPASYPEPALNSIPASVMQARKAQRRATKAGLRSRR